MEANGFWQRSATKAAIAMIATAWLPVVVSFATLKDPLPTDVEYAIRLSFDAILIACGVARWAAPSAPMPPPK
jgi:thiazole synthase ThiGH ThiG subunit